MFRIALILVSLLFAIPAAAMPACHEVAATSSAIHHGAPHRAPDAAPPHLCPGCIPPSDWLAPRIAAPMLAPAAAPDARVTRLDLGRAPPPLLRPPRLG